MKPEQYAAAEAIARGDSKTIAATAAGVTPRTVNRWLADDVAFSDAVSELRDAYIAEAASLLAHASTSAARKLHDLITDGEDTHALRASQTVLDMAARYRADTQLENRIRALELTAGLRTSGET